MIKSKNKNILIVHGWDASPSQHWFFPAKEKFEKAGFNVFLPEMPGNYFPKKEEWLKIIEETVKGDDWIFIGHSLGGVAVLKYLENAPFRAKHIILIATAYEPMSFQPIENFFDMPFEWEKIKSNCPKFDIVIESDDPVVPTEHGKNFVKNLGGKLHILPGGTHFHSIDLDFLEGLIK